MKTYIENADKYINKHYSLWSAEGQKKLKECLIIVIKNKHLQIKIKK